MKIITVLYENLGLLIAVMGCVFILIACFGALRMPDLFTRMHSSTKAAPLGLSLVFTGAAFHFSSMDVAVKAVIGIAFIAFTAPVGAHALARSFYFLNTRPWPGTLVDEFDDAHKNKAMNADKE